MLAAVALASTATREPRFKLIYETQLNGPGGTPTRLVATGAGVYYGLAVAQSRTRGASVFRISASGSYETAHAFPPSFSGFSLVRLASGLLFGDGGFVQGADRGYRYFSFDPATGAYQECLAEPGKVPGALIASPDGGVFGLTATGLQQFTLSRILLDGKTTTVHKFTEAEGIPYRGETLNVAPDGAFYGIASSRASGVSKGWLFRISPAGDYEKLTAIEPFATAGLAAPLIVARDGAIYFALAQGGANRTGSVVRYRPGGSLEAIAEFPPKGGMSRPATLFEGRDGLLYGSDDRIPSSVFSVNTKTHRLKELFAFDDEAQQGQCPCALVEAADGSFFGVAAGGGKIGTGTVFHISR